MPPRRAPCHHLSVTIQFKNRVSITPRPLMDHIGAARQNKQNRVFVHRPIDVVGKGTVQKSAAGGLVSAGMDSAMKITSLVGLSTQLIKNCVHGSDESSWGHLMTVCFWPT